MSDKKINNNKVTTLSSEFQKEIKERKMPNNWLVLSSVVVISLVVISALVIGTYDIFFKPEKIVNKSNSGKIESKPIDEKIKVNDSQDQAAVPSQSIPATEASSTEEYIIVDGDNLGSIATKFGTTAEKLKAANGIEDETLLQIGQKIKIVK